VTTLCVDVTHLFLGTQADNMHDMAAKARARSPRGEENYAAKLTEEIVAHVRASSENHATLARLYGVSCQSIYAARRGITWRHSYHQQGA